VPVSLPRQLPRLRAPREHGRILAEPLLEQAGFLLELNRHALATAPTLLLGRPLPELRRLARAETWDAAKRYAAEANEPVAAEPIDGQPWLLAGHQPEQFHPGVWFKNFALRGLARRHGAFSLNLVVDNDAVRTPRLHIPAGERVASVPYDRWQGESTYEERPVFDEALFASLPGQVAPYTRGWPFEPLLPDYWAEVLRQKERTPLLGERLAAARRVSERRWGCVQAEVPLSRVCRSEAFAWFAAHLVVNAARLRTIYNDAVHDYRRRHRIRTRFRPVPDLTGEGSWCEVPLWAWRPDQRRRSRLFVRQTGRDLELRAGTEAWPSLPWRDDPARLVEAWRGLEERGYKVRTRALTTTLFARLLLGDLFIHGIGGGKYDELTDALIAQFLDGPVPGYLVLTATLLLPLPAYPATAETCGRLGREYRDVWHNPQRHLPGDVPAAARDLAREKQTWVERSCATHAERRMRFHQLRELTERLRPFVGAEAEQLRREREECDSRLRVNRVLGRRDYAFCLYPEEMLREFFGGYV
jgi:hypothetical protein